MAGNFGGRWGDYRGMDCERYRLGISSRLDGEDAGLDDATLARHLAGCAPCRRFESDAIGLTRTVRAAATGATPDLAPALMAAVNRERVAGRRFDPRALRAGLIALALVQMALALPILLFGREAGAPVHVAREVGSFDFALAVGFLFVGWRPVRAYGMLPLVAALVGCLAVTTAFDVARGTATLLNESAHLVDLLGLAVVWEFARTEGPLRGAGGRRRLTPVT